MEFCSAAPRLPVGVRSLVVVLVQQAETLPRNPVAHAWLACLLGFTMLLSSRGQPTALFHLKALAVKTLANSSATNEAKSAAISQLFRLLE